MPIQNVCCEKGDIFNCSDKYCDGGTEYELNSEPIGQLHSIELDKFVLIITKCPLFIHKRNEMMQSCGAEDSAGQYSTQCSILASLINVH